MNKQQLAAIRCAYLDLMGAKEAADNGEIRSHDWESHWETIKEMEKAFATELDGLIVFGEFATDDERSNGPHQSKFVPA